MSKINWPAFSLPSRGLVSAPAAWAWTNLSAAGSRLDGRRGTLNPKVVELLKFCEELPADPGDMRRADIEKSARFQLERCHLSSTLSWFCHSTPAPTGSSAGLGLLPTLISAAVSHDLFLGAFQRNFCVNIWVQPSAHILRESSGFGIVKGLDLSYAWYPLRRDTISIASVDAPAPALVQIFFHHQGSQRSYR